MWINPDTLQQFESHSAIRAAFPNVSFPTSMQAGDIEGVGLAPIAAQAAPDFDPITHALVELPPTLIEGQWTQQWQVNALSQEVATANLAAARAARWEAIKATRTARTAGGVLVGEKWFHTDGASRIQWLALVMLGVNVPAQDWKTMDNSFIALTPALVQQVFVAMVTKEQAIFTHAETLRAQVYASSNPAEVDIGAGWPAVFGEA